MYTLLMSDEKTKITANVIIKPRSAPSSNHTQKKRL